MKKKVLIVGATGLIGKNLVQKIINNDYDAIAATRNIDKAKEILRNKIEIVPFSENSEKFKDALIKSDAIVNLSGASIAGKLWSESYKKEIYESRIRSVETIYQVLSSISDFQNKKTFINASAIGYYPNSDEVQDENFPPGENFLAKVCVDWENAAKKIEALGARTAILRIGMVLAKEGGALSYMKLPFLFFLGGPLCSKKNYVSWIHIEDLTNIFLRAIDDENFRGVYNASSPGFCSMEEFSKALGKSLNRPSWLYVPEKIIKIVLKDAAEAACSNQKIYPKRLLDNGFVFEFDNITKALNHLFS
jgi:hypothetical protein